MQVKLNFFIEFRSQLSYAIAIPSVHVAQLSAVTEMKCSVALQTWALLPHTNSLFLFTCLTSKGAFLVELSPVSHQEHPFGSVGLIKH